VGKGVGWRGIGIGGCSPAAACGGRAAGDFGGTGCPRDEMGCGVRAAGRGRRLRDGCKSKCNVNEYSKIKRGEQ
jgi:hypothetical protein